jgi:hypothetical protein
MTPEESYQYLNPDRSLPQSQTQNAQSGGLRALEFRPPVPVRKTVESYTSGFGIHNPDYSFPPQPDLSQSLNPANYPHQIYEVNQGLQVPAQEPPYLNTVRTTYESQIIFQGTQRTQANQTLGGGNLYSQIDQDTQRDQGNLGSDNSWYTGGFPFPTGGQGPHGEMADVNLDLGLKNNAAEIIKKNEKKPVEEKTEDAKRKYILTKKRDEKRNNKRVALIAIPLLTLFLSNASRDNIITVFGGENFWKEFGSPEALQEAQDWVKTMEAMQSKPIEVKPEDPKEKEREIRRKSKEKYYKIQAAILVVSLLPSDVNLDLGSVKKICGGEDIWKKEFGSAKTVEELKKNAAEIIKKKEEKKENDGRVNKRRKINPEEGVKDIT